VIGLAFARRSILGPNKMTLLLTEVHCLTDDLTDSVIVFAADRRLSTSGRYHATKKKLFEVPGLRAGLGFFGLAEFRAENMPVSISDWLKRFIDTKSSTYDSLMDFARGLAKELNQLVPDSIRRREVSGFHLSGLNREGIPEFWFIRNVDDDRQTVVGTYSAREDFLSRDVQKVHTGEARIISYRNGDIRGHIAAWERLDEAFFSLLQEPEFRLPRTSDEYGAWVKFKMQVLVHFYKQYCSSSILGGPIDTLVIRGPRRKAR